MDNTHRQIFNKCYELDHHPQKLLQASQGEGKSVKEILKYMLTKVAVVVVLEGDNDALVHGLGDGRGVWWQEDRFDGLEGAVDARMGSAIVQDEGHLPLLSCDVAVLFVKPGAEEVTNHPGLLVGVALYWQLMDVDPLLAEDVWLPAAVGDQGLQLVGAGHVGHRHHYDRKPIPSWS